MSLCYVSAQIPTNGLVAYYQFNDNANDVSSNGNDGTVNGATPTTDRFGISNKAYSFNGTSDFIEVSNSTSLNILNSISITAWFKTDDPDINHSDNDGVEIVAKAETHGSRSYDIFLHDQSYLGDDSICFDLYKTNDVDYDNTISSTLWDNTWHFVATTYDYTSGISQVYIDGQLKKSLNIGQINLEQTNVPLTIGCYLTPLSEQYRGFYHGVLDDICIYNRSLNQGGIDSLYYEPSSNCLVAYYPFNGNANDASSNSNNGTVNGATSTTDRFGISNKAYSFNGTSDFIEVPNSASLSILNSISMAAWFKTNDPDINHSDNDGAMIVAKHKAHYSRSFSIAFYDQSYFGDSISFQLFKTDDTENLNNISSTYWDNNWHFIATTYDYTSGISQVYIDNLLKKTMNFGQVDLMQTLIPLTIGCYFGDVSGYRGFYNGELDDIRIFNCALDKTEIDSLYHEGGWAGVKDIFLNNEINIYPNPANDNIIIENSTFAKNQTISVYNIQGNMLLQQAIWQTKTEIDISTLAKGIYFVNLKTKEEGITKKFIKN